MNVFFILLLFLLSLSCRADIAKLFQNPPEDMTRPCITFALAGGRADDGEYAIRQLHRAEELGAGGVLVSLPRAEPDVWTNWIAIVKKAKQLKLDVTFRDFALTNSPAIGTNDLSRGQLSRHINQLLYESQTLLRETYGSTVLGYYFDYVPRGTCDIINDLVQESGLRAGMGIFSAPLAPEENAVYFQRPVLQLTVRRPFSGTNAVEYVLEQRRKRARENFNRRAGGGGRTFWRKQIWGMITMAETNPPAAEYGLLPFHWKQSADSLLAAGATRIVLNTGRNIPSDDLWFRETRDAFQYLHRCSFLLQQGVPVTDFLFWPGPLSDSLPENNSYDVANWSMLSRAVFRNGQIHFPSERIYRMLVVTTNAIQGHVASRILSRCEQGNIPVKIWPEHPDPDLKWTTEGTNHVAELRFLHRRTKEWEIYFLVNPHPVATVVSATFRDTGRGVPSRWNPLTGDISYPEIFTRFPNGSVRVPLFLDACDSCFLLFARTADSSSE